MRQFISELKRRGVIPVAAVYVVGVWVMLQAADILFPAWDIAAENIRLIVYAALLGFPIALIFGWRYDITSEGVIRTPPATRDEREELDRSLSSRDFLTLGVLVAITVMIGGWLFHELAIDKPIAPIGAPNSVAVLPFELQGGDAVAAVPDLADHLVSSLIGISGLKVTGRESSFYFAGSNEPLAKIAKVLNVRHLITGQVAANGSHMTVNIQLVRLPDAKSIWAQSYSIAADRIHAMLDDVGTQVAAAMRINMPDAEKARLATPTVDDRELTKLIRLHEIKQQDASWEDSRALMDQAVERFPESVTAHVERALAYLDSYTMSGTPSLVELHEAVGDSLDRAAALGADTIDYYLARAYEARRQIRTSGTTPALEKAVEDNFEQVIALNPSDAQPYVSYSIYFRRQRVYTRAGELLETALDYDPLHSGAIWQYSRYLSAVGRNDEALEYALRLPEYFNYGHEAVAHRYWENQELDKAIEWFLRIPDRSAFQQWIIAIVWAGLKAPTEAIEVLESIENDATLMPVASSMVAAMQGDMVLAYETISGFVDETGTRDPRVLRRAVNYALRAGRYEDAVRLIEHSVPGLADPVAPYVDEPVALDALRLAFALTQSPGNDVRAGILSSLVLNGSRGRPRLGWDGIGVRDAMVYAFQGDTVRAISAVRQAYDAGWRNLYDEIGLLPSPLESLVGEPEFDEIVAAIDRDLAAMRESARQTVN